MTVQQSILDELESSLIEQLKLARKGELRGIEDLTARTQEIIGQLGSISPAALTEQHSQCERIRELYRQLTLGLAAQRQEVTVKLGAMRKGKGALGAYRNRPTR